ncbi:MULTISPECIES: hypothetical protein [unclassified Pseudomonas]|uniref:hypothetical protein n=1 Tax=unclassified Pseudomonas TaxID=196821 RepID=UPI000C1865F2|nr:MULTISPECIES: hypothetical protein [unclassified Pseudomonas]MBS3186628.1 hypothetical protein [Pseudomonas sp. PCH44]PIK77077.1 hypothetical protein CQW31_18650 [Pseudomonas sp. 382]
MSSETLRIEISWPASMTVPAGATINAQLWAGNASAGYSLIGDLDASAAAVSSPAILEIPYSQEDLQSHDGKTTWDYFHTSPYLAHDNKRLNIGYAQKISIADAKANGWKINLR